MVVVTVPRQSITQAAAATLIDRAIVRANELGQNVSIAVTDTGGNLVRFARMDGAKLTTIQVATDKAYMSAATNMATNDWWERIKDYPELISTLPKTMDRIVFFGGGRPILVNDECVGGIGVSGSHFFNDMEISAYALDGLNDL